MSGGNNRKINSQNKKNRSNHEFIGATLIIISAFFLLCLLFPFFLSAIAEWIKEVLTGVLGASAYVLFVITLFCGIFIVKGNSLSISKKRLVFIIFLSIFGLLLSQTATTHNLLKQDSISEYLSGVYDYANNFSVGGAFLGIFVYGVKSIVSIVGTYIFFVFTFILFAVLLGLDIKSANSPQRANKRSYKNTQSESNYVPFMKSGMESAPIRPVSNNGLYVGNIIPREGRVISEGGKFTDIENKKTVPPQKKLSDFFDSVKSQNDNQSAPKERVNAKKVLFDDYEKMQQDAAARFMSSLNTEKEIYRQEINQSQSVETPRSAYAAPDIKNDEMDSPLKKADKKNMEVVFPPPKDPPPIIPGEIINGEKVSSSIKGETKRFDQQDKYFYDDKYDYQDKLDESRQFFDNNFGIEGDNFESPQQEIPQDDIEENEIINGDFFDEYKERKKAEERKKIKEQRCVDSIDSYQTDSYSCYSQNNFDNIQANGFDDKTRDTIFEMPVDFEYENQDDLTQSNQENSFDYSARQELEYNNFAEQEQPQPIQSGYDINFAQGSNGYVEAIQQPQPIIEKQKEQVEITQQTQPIIERQKQQVIEKQKEQTEITQQPQPIIGQEQEPIQNCTADESLDFVNPYGDEIEESQEAQSQPKPDLTFVNRINKYEEALKSGDKQKEEILQEASTNKEPLADSQSAYSNQEEDAEIKEDYTGYYIKNQSPKPEKQRTFIERTKALKQKINPKDQINMEGYLSDAAKEEASEQKPKRKRNARYVPPPSYLLTSESTTDDESNTDYEANITLLEETLRNLKLPAKVKNITRGPAVTRYELEMPPGTTVKRIEGFSQDIAYALASSGGIRIEAPIPGKRAVGVEVPNSVIGLVGLRDLIESNEFNKNSSHMSICIGKDIAGKNIVAPLEKMPHLLVAGSTGSGKSACLHSIIVSILYKSSPSDVRLILIDPKRVEFPFYKDLPHLLINQIINEREHAINAFKWVKEEMTARYKQLSKIGARNQQEFNLSAAVRSGEEERLPSIVIVVDELSDLMSGGLKKEMEEHILSIAQLGRAAGIHLILATQRPSVDVITGTIKVNFPSRIALAVSNAVDSKTILDQSGAEMLLGRGDLLYAPIDAPDPKRIQGAYVTGEEVEEIVKFINENNQSEYYDDIESIIMREKEKEEAEENNEDDADEEFDSLLEEVARKVIETGQASTSMMQRRFKLGYARASRIVDQLERYGFIGPMDINRPTKPREVFITRESFKDFFGHDY